MTWTPASARTLVIPRRDATPRGYVPAPLPLRWPDKMPTASLDYSLDVRNDIAADDSITDATFVVVDGTDGGVTIGSTQFSGTVASIWVDGGANGSDYMVTATIGTDQGRTLAYDVGMLVVDEGVLFAPIAEAPVIPAWLLSAVSAAVAAAAAAQSSADSKLPLASVGAAGGAASLDSGGHVPLAQITPAILGLVNYRGGYNAATNTPTISSNGGGGSAGDMLGVTVAGTVAADSIGAVFPPDALVNTGSHWVRYPYSIGLGGMSAQSAAAVAITGGTIAGLTSLGLADGSTIQPSYEPDVAWLVRDSSGNIVLELDFHGLLSLAAAYAKELTVDSLTINEPFVVPSVETDELILSGITLTTAPTYLPDIIDPVVDGSGNVIAHWGLDGTRYYAAANVVEATIGTLMVTGDMSLDGAFAAAEAAIDDLTIDNMEIVSVATYDPDLTHTVADQDGNIVSGYDKATGAFKVAAADVGELTVNGVAVASSSGMADAVDVRAAPFYAVGTAVKNDAYVTVSGGSPNVVTIRNFTGSVSLTQTTSTTATLTFTDVQFSGVAGQPSLAGKMLYLKVGSYQLQAPVLQYRDSNTLLLTASGVTEISAQTGTWVCPSFVAGNVGDYLVFDGAGQEAWLSNAGTVRNANTQELTGQLAFVSRIALVNAPDQVQLADTIPFAWSDYPARLRWGPNDMEAVAQAGVYAVRNNIKTLHFSGTGSYLLLGVGDVAERMAYIDLPATSVNAALNWTMWVGAETWACDCGGLVYMKQSAPAHASTSRHVEPMVFGPSTFKRASQLSVVNVVVCGDSLVLYDPQFEQASANLAHRIKRAFVDSNPNVTVNVWFVGTGGGTYSSLISPAVHIQEATGPGAGAVMPRPIAGSPVLLDCLTNVNHTGSGDPIKPDVLVIAISGVNDHRDVHGDSMRYLINTVRAIDHGDSCGPTDIVLVPDRGVIYHSTTTGLDAGTRIGSISQAYYAEFAASLTRSFAAKNGFGCVDIASLNDRVYLGSDPMNQTYGRFPSVTKTASPTNPLQLAVKVRDFKVWVDCPGSPIPDMDIQISPHQGNLLMLRTGTNGHLWFGVSAWGMRVPTVCTIASGGTTLTVAAPTSFTGQTITAPTYWPQLTTTGNTFTSDHAGKCIVAPLGHIISSGVYEVQRTYIRNYLDQHCVWLYDGMSNGTGYSGITGRTFTIGGQHFVPADAVVKPHVVVFFPSGRIWSTSVASYTSATQVELADAAPEALSGATIQLFVGYMGTGWTDTGYDLTGLGEGPTLQIEVRKNSLMLGVVPDKAQLTRFLADVNTVRYGCPFYPVFTPLSERQLVLSNIMVEAQTPFRPTSTPVGLRGVPTSLPTVTSSYETGGVSSHPGAGVDAQVFGPVFAANRFNFR